MNPTRRLTKNGWRWWHAFAAVLLTGVGLALTWPAWVQIEHLARTEPTGRHVWLVPIIFVWLVWVRRWRMGYCHPRGHWIGLALIAPGAIALALAGLIDSLGGLDVSWFESGWRMVWHEGAVLVTLGCLLTVLGRDVFRQFLPAFAVLVFLVPLSPTLAQDWASPLQLGAAEMTVWIYQQLGIASSMNGTVMRIGSTHLPVYQLCQGMPMVFDLFLVSWAFVFGTPLRPGVRLVILALSPISAILFATIGMALTSWSFASVSPTQAGVIHQLGGWAMLLGAFGLLAAVIQALAWASVPVRPYALAYDV